METIVVKPVCGIPVVKREPNSRQIRNFRRTMRLLATESRIKLGHIRCYQPLNAEIYPNKFVERDREEKNPAYVEGSEIWRTDPYNAYFSRSNEGDDVNIRADDSVEAVGALEYIDDICSFYKSEEESTCLKSGYIARLNLNFDKKSRASIVQWMIEAQEVFEFPTEALYLAINLFDRFMAVHPVERKKVGLVGVTAVELAVKYAGMRDSIPCVDLFSDLALTLCPVKEISCSIEQILQMEDLILNTLEYDLSVPIPSTFMWKFLKETQSDEKIKHLSFFFIDLCLVRRQTRTFRPSVLAAAAIYTAHATVKGCKPCSKIYEQLTGCSARQILKCSRLMVTSHQKARRSVKSVYKKYRTRRYGYVARARPAHFLLKTKLRTARTFIFKLILFLMRDV